jgi:hypothetical protein
MEFHALNQGGFAAEFSERALNKIPPKLGEAPHKISRRGGEMSRVGDE